MVKTIELDGTSFHLRYLFSLLEVFKVQQLDTETLPEGFKMYGDLYRTDTRSILIAETAGSRFAAHVGFNRIKGKRIFQRMPPWDHNHEDMYAETGNTLYILGHVVRKEFERIGLSHTLIDYLKELATIDSGIARIAVMARTKHPTLGDRAVKYWESNGFEKLDETEDSGWKASADAGDSGGVICAVNVLN